MAGLYETTVLMGVQRKVKSLPAFFLQWFPRQINFQEDQIARSSRTLPASRRLSHLPRKAV